MKKPDSTRLWFLAATVIALALPPLVLRAQPDGMAEVRRRVTDMTATEREQFERNSSDYLKLTEEQRAQYRAIHAALEQDREQGQGRLAQALDDYYAWLLTLDVFPRQDLRTTSDPQQRIAKIETVLEDQAQEQLREYQFPRRQFDRVPTLTSDQLQAMMSALERSVSLTQEEYGRLEALSGIERYSEFFRILKNRNVRIDQILDREDTVERLVAALPGQKLPDWAQGEDDTEQRKLHLASVLFWNLFREHQIEIRRVKPSDEELEEFVRNWPPDKGEDLDRLLELEPDRFLQAVQWAYVAHNSKLDFNVVREVISFENWYRRGNGTRPQFNADRPRGPESDDRSRGFDINRPDRRPRGDRNNEGPGEGAFRFRPGPDFRSDEPDPAADAS